MDQLLDAESAFVEEPKIVDYLLDLEHPDGGPKAVEHERVVLEKDLPEKALKSGDVGTVVAVHENADGGVADYTLEFFALSGETVAIATVNADAVRMAGSNEVTHARSL